MTARAARAILDQLAKGHRDRSCQPPGVPCAQCRVVQEWRWWEDRGGRYPSHWRRPLPLCHACQAQVDRRERVARWEGRLRRAGIPQRYWSWRLTDRYGDGVCCDDVRDGLRMLMATEHEAVHYVLVHEGIGDAWAALDAMRHDRVASLVLEGGVGVGKTLLLSVLACHLLWPELRIRISYGQEGARYASREGGLSVVYTSEGELLSEVRRRRAGYSEREGPHPVARAVRAQVLILDELGSQAQGGESGAWKAEVIEEVVDGRYRAGMPILAATNLESEQLGKRLGLRTVDRLREMAGRRWYCLSGGSWRER